MFTSKGITAVKDPKPQLTARIATFGAVQGCRGSVQGRSAHTFASHAANRLREASRAAPSCGANVRGTESFDATRRAYARHAALFTLGWAYGPVSEIAAG
jgi:hypothetical protein